MLKLLKYELIHSWRTFGVVYLAFLLVCFIIPFTNPMYSGNLLSNFLLFILIFLTIGISVSIIVSIAMTFNRSMFKRPGYLTLTLPVNTHQLLLSKLVANVLWIFISSLVLFFGFFIMAILLGVTAGEFVFTMSDFFDLLTIFEYVDWYQLFIFTISGLSTCIMSLLLIYLSITAAHTKFITRFKTGFSLIFYFVASYLFSSIFNFIENTFFNFTSQFWLNDLYLTIGVTIIFAVLYYFASYYIIEHKLEIE